jgi:hypothetical protein
MNDPNTFWDDDLEGNLTNPSVYRNTPPPEIVTPEFPFSCENHPWDNDLEFLEGDNLYVPENIPSLETLTPEFSSNDENPYLHDDLEFLEGSSLCFPGNTPLTESIAPEFSSNDENSYWDIDSAFLGAHNVHVSQTIPYPEAVALDVSSNDEKSYCDNDLGFLGADNLYISGTSPAPAETSTPQFSFGMNNENNFWDNNSEPLETLHSETATPASSLRTNDKNYFSSNDIESSLEGDSLFISGNTPILENATSGYSLCPIVQSIIDGTYDASRQPDNPIPESVDLQYNIPWSAFEMSSSSIEWLSNLPDVAAGQDGAIPSELGSLAD